MGHIIGVLGGVLVGLAIIAGAASGLYSAFSKNNIANTEENLVLLRMQTQSFFLGTNYDGLSNEVAINAGIVPEGFLRGGAMRNAWGGDITLTPDSANGQFSIEMANIPQQECTQLARFQGDAWASVSVNGSDVDPADPSAISQVCGTTNTLTFTAR